MIPYAESTINKLNGLNKLIEDVLKQDLRISSVLKKNGLRNVELDEIKNQKLDMFLDHCIYALQCALIGSFSGNRQAKILLMRYGLDGTKGCTLKEIGDYFDISRERIRQIETKILRKFSTTSSRRILEDAILFSACTVLHIDFIVRKMDRIEM